MLREFIREEIAAATPPPAPAREWFSIVEAGDYLRVSESTVARLVSDGRLRSTTIDRRRIVKRTWLDEFAMARER